MTSPGDTVYADFGSHGDIDARKGIVQKVTPTVQIVAKFDDGDVRRFMPDGRMIGGSEWFPPHLITEAKYTRLRAEQTRRAGRRKLQYHVSQFRFTTRAQAITDIERFLEMAKAMDDD